MEARERLAITRIAIVLAKADGMSAADAHMFHDSAAAILKALNLTDTAALALMDGEGMVVPNYPAGDVIGPCRCGSWPGGKCFKCPTTDSSPYKETTNE